MRDDTKTVLRETDASVIRGMLNKLSEHEVVEGQGPVGNLVAEALEARNIDF